MRVRLFDWLPQDLDAEENYGREHIQALLSMVSHTQKYLNGRVKAKRLQLDPPESRQGCYHHGLVHTRYSFPRLGASCERRVWR